MEFRIIQIEDVTVSDFYNLPFWIESNDHKVWVSIHHVVVRGELIDEIHAQRVIDNIAQQAFIWWPNGVTVKQSGIDYVANQLQHNFEYQAVSEGVVNEHESSEPRY